MYGKKVHETKRKGLGGKRFWGCARSVAEKQGGSVLSVQMVFLLKVTVRMAKKEGRGKIP